MYDLVIKDNITNTFQELGVYVNVITIIIDKFQGRFL